VIVTSGITFEVSKKVPKHSLDLNSVILKMDGKFPPKRRKKKLITLYGVITRRTINWATPTVRDWGLVR